jgi:glycosyltransferase involved in cell wall biosynthesis
VDPAKVRVIFNGVSEKFYPRTDETALQEVRRKYRLPDRYAFWAGDFRPEKNLSFLIQGWARLKQRVSDLPDLVLAGYHAGRYKAVREEVKNLGLERSVVFPGFVAGDDLAQMYSAATLFVFPSLYEGFGLPPLEAMACGTPSVVSNSSSLPEVTGSAALLFNPTSLDSFEDCVIKLLTHPELADNLRTEGLHQSAQFSWSSAAEETLAVYRSVLERSGRDLAR